MKFLSKIRRLFKPSKYSKRIFIDNFGFKNRGDQLMIQSVMEQVRSHIPTAQILVRKNVFNENPSFCIENKIFPLELNNSGVQKNKFIKRITNRLIGDDWLISPKDVDVVLDCCGYYINDVWHKSENSYKNVREYFAKFCKPGVKIIYLPQAFGPFGNEWSKKIGFLAYERAIKIYAREKESYKYLKNLVEDDKKLSIAPDFTCLLKGSSSPVVQIPHSQYVLVIPNSNMIGNTKSNISSKYIDFLQAIIEHMTEEGETVCLLNHEGDIEEKLLVEINQKLKKPVVILTKLSGVDIKGIIRNAKLVITARFHGAVSALTQHVPTLVTSWSHKYAALLQEHKCEQSMLEVTDVSESIKKIDDALLHPETYSSKAGCEEKIESQTQKMWNEVFSLIK